MRFVTVKSADRQAALLDHKARDVLVRQRTEAVNAIPAHLSKFGIVTPKAWFRHDAKGIHHLERRLDAACDGPEAARPALDLLAGQLRDIERRIEKATARIAAAQKTNPLTRRLATLPVLGPIASSAFAAATPDVTAFGSARDHAAWLRMTPRAHSSGGQERLGRISKAGDGYLRRWLCLGASCRRHASGVAARIGDRRGRPAAPANAVPDRLDRMLARKPVKLAAVALAVRMARRVWALIARGGSHRAMPS